MNDEHVGHIRLNNKWVKFKDAKTSVPVYLPDRTVIGKAEVTVDAMGVSVTIKFNTDTPIVELMTEELIGLSVVYQDNRARDLVEYALSEQNKEEMEKTDE